MGSPHTSSTAYLRGIGACLQLSIAVDGFLNKLSALYCGNNSNPLINVR